MAQDRPKQTQPAYFSEVDTISQEIGFRAAIGAVRAPAVRPLRAQKRWRLSVGTWLASVLLPVIFHQLLAPSGAKVGQRGMGFLP